MKLFLLLLLQHFASIVAFSLISPECSFYQIRTKPAQLSGTGCTRSCKIRLTKRYGLFQADAESDGASKLPLESTNSTSTSGSTKFASAIASTLDAPVSDADLDVLDFLDDITENEHDLVASQKEIVATLKDMAISTTAESVPSSNNRRIQDSQSDSLAQDAAADDLEPTIWKILTEGGVNPLLESNFINRENSGNVFKNGIGGDGGVVYDVNRLKRNLLQETMQAFKQDLLRLLNTPDATEHAIVDKLAALVQASPVRTTTDSNLLDGTWGLAYLSKYTTLQDLKTSVVERRRRARTQAEDKEKQSSSLPPAHRNTGGKEGLWRTSQRVFYLEDVSDDEDAYVLDHQFYVGGWLTKTTRSAVRGLTRQSLRLEPLCSTWTIGGRAIKNNTSSLPISQSWQFIYSDIDLCIVADSTQNAFAVYTKHEDWVDSTQRRRRKWRLARDYFPTLMRSRRMSAASMTLQHQKSWETAQRGDPLIREITLDQARLRVLKLGDLSFSMDDEGAWDGMADPFVHLTADERQRVLKAMRVKDVEAAGKDRRSQAQRWGWLTRMNPSSRRTYFKKPKDKQRDAE
jgi:hypothetical protein